VECKGKEFGLFVLIFGRFLTLLLPLFLPMHHQNYNKDQKNGDEHRSGGNQELQKSLSDDEQAV
jgi:hypothetical protein